MVKRLFCIVFFSLTITTGAFCQNKLRFEQLPISMQDGFKQIAAKYRSGQVEYRSVENDLKNSGIDFSQMSVEDAVMMMFMLISEDARKDMKSMLEEMDAARLKRTALHQAAESMKKEIDSLKNQASNKYSSDSRVMTKKLNEKVIKLQQYSSQEKEAIAEDNKTAENKNAAEKHLQVVEEAITKLQQIQSQRKHQ